MLVGIIGFGAVGKWVAEWIERTEGFELTAILDAVKKSHEKLTTDVDEFLSRKMDVVVEAASQDAVKVYAERIIESGRHLIVLSVGAFADAEFFQRIREACMKTGKKVFIASGAIAGLDAIYSASELVEEVVITTRKNWRQFGRRGVVFEGYASEAATRFPKNLNVAIALSIAAGMEARVRLVGDDVEENIHEIVARGRFGEINIRIKNLPMEDNPKTSYLAALSVTRILRNLKGGVVV
ncbi:aspartate dehydrogenase [Archaeoglobus neptunius]|uniref:aspartate dehydrogenase n=1 Tax=Archaeoglobus neptunius TaxID=2798580 RepID=UPI001928842A|nr:aspartate dehydrogenase [Archaeoglobus neptunius]